MKTITRTLFVAVALIVASCTDLSEVTERLDSLETRIEAIEAVLPSLNANISALQELAGGSTVNKVEQPSPGVYELTLSNGSKITLNQGSIGVGKAPVMSIDSDGYWMADYQDGAGAQYVLSGSSKVPALGEDGTTPVFGVDASGCWTVSYDSGRTFTPVKGSDGNPVKALGEEGASDSYFSEVSVSGDVLTLKLKSGQVYRVPVVSDFLFAIKDAEDIQLFNPGDVKSYEVEMNGVVDAIFSKPSGWEVTLTDQMLKIKSPSAITKATIADSEGEVAVLAVSSNGYSAIAKVKVQLAGAVVEVNPAASISLAGKGETTIEFKVLTEDVTGWYYIFQSTAAPAPDAAALLSSGTRGSGASLPFSSLESKTSYTLYVLPVNDAKQGTVASLSVTTDAEKIILYADNLAAWNEGKVINIAGEKYSKSRNGEATVLKAETADTEISGLDPGVYILEAGSGSNFIVNHNDNGLILSGDVILIGRYAANKPLVKLVGYAKIGGGFAMRDIQLDCSVSTKNYKFTFTGLTDFFHIDACRVIAFNRDQSAYSTNLTKSLRIVNSDITYNKGNGESAIGINFSSTTHMYDLKELTVDNNIFYNAQPMLYQLAGCNGNAKVENQVGTPGGFSISLCNNTFYNITSSSAAGALFVALSADVVTIDGNIFYTKATSGAHRCLRLYDSSKPMPTTLNIGTNIAYGLAFASAWKYIYDTAEVVMTRVAESPFETVNESTLTFIPVESYFEFGAQRN